MANYALINETGGWLENIIVWDGNLETWQPPEGTIAKQIEEVDFSSLPQKPDDSDNTIVNDNT